MPSIASPAERGPLEYHKGTNRRTTAGNDRSTFPSPPETGFPERTAVVPEGWSMIAPGPLSPCQPVPYPCPPPTGPHPSTIMRSTKVLWLLCGLLWWSSSHALRAAENPAAAPVELPAQLQRFATRLLRDNLPEEYHDTRHWGQQRDCLSGLDIRFEDGRLETHRRYRPMNHGTWKRYQIRPIDPDQTLRVHIGPARPQPDGRSAFTLELDARLHGLAQWVEWRHGVRLGSVTAEGDARVRLRLDCLLGMQWDASQLPPELLLKPEVTRADFQLADFDLQRIGPLEGPVVHELGKVLRDLAQWQLDQKRAALTARLNRQIARHQDDLRLSALGQLPILPKLPAARPEAKPERP